MTIEQISDPIKSVGLVIAGLWTAWTFHRLQKVRDANLTIAVKEKQLLGAQPQLGVQLNALELPSPVEQHSSVLSITVTLSNLGTQNLLVRFRKHTLSIAKVELSKVGPQSIDTAQAFGPLYFDEDNGKPKHLPFRIMRVGQVRKTVLANIPVDEPCAYLIQFYASYWRVPFDGESASKGDKSLTKAEKDGGPPDPEGGHVIQAIEQIFYVVTGKPAETMAT